MSSSLRRLIAVCLLLVWGPASLCCALEAAGWEVVCSESGCHAGDADQAPGDGCNAVESGDYQNAGVSLKMVPTTAVLCTCLLCLRDLADTPPRLIASADTTLRPQDWVVRWQFQRRAAAPAHAPDRLNA